MTGDPLQIVGRTIADKYLIEQLVGEGGFAVVYRAQHTIWKRPVAIKFFNGLSNAPVGERDKFQEAFVQEGALLTELSSQTASIVQARDIGTYTTDDGQWMPFMVLEWLEGSSLEELLEREREQGQGPWGLAQVVTVLEQVAGALDVAHGRGIAHRDIKPANLFVLGDVRSANATVKVLDFGVAKMMTENTHMKAAMARTGMSVTSFTPQYGAPEQFDRNHGATGPWTDVFALALVAVELLCGHCALDGLDLVQLAVCSANPMRRPTPRTMGAAVPDEVERVFQRALAVSPAERYARAGEFWRALTQAAGMAEPTSSGRGAPLQREQAEAATEFAPQVSLAPSLPGSGAALDAPSSALAPAQPAVPTRISSRAPAARKGGAAVIALGAVVVAAAVGGLLLMRSGGRGAATGPSARTAQPMAAEPLPAASAAPAPPSCPDDMALIPKGQYFMGSDAADAMDNQKPSHNVALGAFCVDLYEVTAAQYKACSDVGKCRRAPTEVHWPDITAADHDAYSPLCTAGDPEKQDHPINCINWDMANTFCKAQDKRLPSEAEWEYAARGPDGRIYPWGDEEPTAEHLNACGTECRIWARQAKVAGQFPGVLYEADDGFPTTAPVGKFPKGRSRFGPYDVVGNVWEWVADWEGAYSKGDQQNPKGPAQGEKKVIRGGAWNGSFPSWLHPSYRYATDPMSRSHGIGFRCAGDPK